MKLELRHLAPYLPYGFKIFVESDGFLQNDETFEVNAITQNGVNVSTKRFPFNTDYSFDEFKLILRPLSDLTKEIEVNGKRFVPIDIMNEYSDLECVPSLLSDNPDALYFSNNDDKIYLTDIYPNHISKLFEWHFDIFNLIENNLAIDINTLK